MKFLYLMLQIGSYHEMWCMCYWKVPSQLKSSSCCIILRILKTSSHLITSMWDFVPFNLVTLVLQVTHLILILSLDWRKFTSKRYVLCNIYCIIILILYSISMLGPRSISTTHYRWSCTNRKSSLELLLVSLWNPDNINGTCIVTSNYCLHGWTYCTLLPTF